MCVFTSKSYSDLSNKEAELRSLSMKKEQEMIDRLSNDINSPRAQAKTLPINRAK